jgi:hypothetical protein
VGVPTFYPNCLCCEQDTDLLPEWVEKENGVYV